MSTKFTLNSKAFIIFIFIFCKLWFFFHKSLLFCTKNWLFLFTSIVQQTQLNLTLLEQPLKFYDIWLIIFGGLANGSHWTLNNCKLGRLFIQTSYKYVSHMPCYPFSWSTGINHIILQFFGFLIKLNTFIRFTRLKFSPAGAPSGGIWGIWA